MPLQVCQEGRLVLSHSTCSLEGYICHSQSIAPPEQSMQTQLALEGTIRNGQPCEFFGPGAVEVGVHKQILHDVSCSAPQFYFTSRSYLGGLQIAQCTELLAGM
jgi:hypothetical protein